MLLEVPQRCDAVFHPNAIAGVGVEQLQLLSLRFENKIYDIAEPIAQAWSGYLKSDYHRMNQILRHEKPDLQTLQLPPITPELAHTMPNQDFHRLRLLENARLLEQTFAHGFPITPGAVFWRGLVLEPHVIPKPGEPWIDAAFMSTAIVQEVDRFISNETVREPLGHRKKVVFRMTNVGYGGKVIPGNHREYELIFPCNTKLEIRSVITDGDTVRIEANLP